MRSSMALRLLGEAVELVAGAGDRQPAGEIAGHDGLRRSGHGVDTVEHASADEESAGEPEHNDQRERPAPGVGNDAVEPLALLEVAPDQEPKAARQLDDLDQRVMFRAFRRLEPAIGGLEPARMVEDARLQRADIAGEPFPGRRGDEVEARAGTPRAQIDDDDQSPEAAFAVLPGQPADFAR